LAVSAFNENSIKNAFTSNISEFSKYAPNVFLSGNNFTGGGINMAIRGISFADLEKSFEPSLGLYLDGVVFATNTGALVDSFDMESIEILRGPQGTLFGRNTVGGVVTMTRTRPTGEFGVKIGARFGSNKRTDFRAVVNFPIVEGKLSAKVASFYNKGDSHTTNIYTEKKDPGKDQFQVYATFLLTPSDDFEMLTTIEYLDDKSLFSSALNLTTPSGFGANGVPIIANICDFGIYGILTQGVSLGEALCKSASFDLAEESGFKLSTNNPDTPHRSFVESFSIYNTINWELGDYTLSAVTGYKDTNDLLDEEGIGAPGFTVFQFHRPQTSDQFSQELTVTSNLDGRFNFVVGAYYFHTSYEMKTGDAIFFGAKSQSYHAQQSTRALAFFGETYFDITDQLTLTTGIRYTDEKKELTFENIVPGPGAPAFGPVEREASWTEPTWRVSLDYQITDQTMVYASYNRGFRSGGFNGRATTIETLGPYEPEKVDSYEVGVRTDMLDERLRANLTAYLMNYKNKQEEIITASGGATATEVSNASNARMQGFELEMTAIISDNFSLRSAASFLDSKYSSFDIPNPFYVPDSTDPLTMDPTIDNADASVRWAPKWTFSLGGTYSVPVGNGGELIFTGNFAYKSSIQTSPRPDPAGRSTVKPTKVVDLGVTYDGPIGMADTNVRVSAFVKDLLKDDNRFGAGVDAGVFFFGLTAPGRTWGVELEADF
jgi:iron complex outermembrane recepter protein